MANPREALIQAVAVTAELTGTELSRAAAKVMVEDLSAYPHGQVTGALTRCRKELRGKLTIAEVLARLDDGRPAPDEAWAMCPKSEAESVVWTDEMAEAFGIAAPLVEADDLIAARMAFREAYTAAVQRARDAHTSPRWWPSLGTDRGGRDQALRMAVARNRISAEQAARLLPGFSAPAITDERIEAQAKRIGRTT
jgi:hypothetical protein